MSSALLMVPLFAWFAVAAIACYSVYRAQRDRILPPVDRYDPAVVIIPVRGVPEHLPEMWKAICAQTYKPFRIVFVVEDKSDMAYTVLQNLRGGPPVEVIAAGPTQFCAQKNHNMLAGLTVLRPDDEVIVFTDADVVPAADWLVRLTWELDKRKISAASGYRWMIPEDERWATAFVCVINSSIATATRDPRWANAWGGAMAMRRHTLEAVDLPKIWGHAADDDMILTRAVRALGGRVRSPRDVLVPTYVSYGWKDAIAFGRRQYLFVRMHAPMLWLLAAATTTIPLLGWAVALPLAVAGNKIAIGVIVVSNVLDHVRARLRERVPRKLWGKEMNPRVRFLDRWATPAWLAVHAYVVWSTLFGRSITWAGRTYWIGADQRLDRIES